MIRRAAVALVVLLLLALAYEWATFPDVASLAREMPESTAFMDLRRAELRAEGKDDTLRYAPVPYERISPYLRRAVLVAEDNAFYEHEGVDAGAMREAIERDWKHGRITHGGSTITQQLAKNLYLSPSRNPLRKVKEIVIARALERNLTKKRILELYLNVVEMGERIYGAEAASRAYFHVPASALSPKQAALLAGCLPNPRTMVPAAPNKRLRWRQQMILSRLHRWGYLFEREVLTEKVPRQPEMPPEAPRPDQAPVPASDTTSTGPDRPDDANEPLDEEVPEVGHPPPAGPVTQPVPSDTGPPGGL